MKRDPLDVHCEIDDGFALCGGNKVPRVPHDHFVQLGETSNCFPIGDVHSTADQVTRALVSMQCNKCGLVDNLTQEQKLAIGEARIVLS